MGNRSPRTNCHSIYPFVLNTTNRKGATDHLTEIKIPDICPSHVIDQNAQFSMAAGEFVQVYKGQLSEWDAVLTCFFLDTAKNIFLYIRTIADIIKQDGFWINLGPLLFHYAESAHEVSVELSWEEVKPAILKYFDVVEEERRVARYTMNPSALMGLQYNCVFFVAKRNAVKVSGASNPVF